MRWQADPHALDWVRDRRRPFLDGRITSLVPTGYAAYARVPHPHREASADILCTVLGRRTEPEQRCTFAVWEGYGWVWGGAVVISTDPAEHGRRPRDDELLVPDHVRDGPRASLPHRDYLLYSGGLVDALALARTGSRWMHDDVPDLWWPDDRAWFVASDTDLDHCTFVGACEVVVDAVLQEPRLDAVRVEPDDQLW